MNYKVSIKHSAEKSLNSLIDKIHDKIIEKIFTLSENPRPIQSKNLNRKNITESVQVITEFLHH